MDSPESLALDVCRAKELDLSNREYFVLVDYLSKDIEARYRKVMNLTPEEVLTTLGLERRSARKLHK